MSRPLLDALALRALSHPPVWIMRQAGRYLPEYRRLRERHTFQEVVGTPELAAEVTLQPIRRFDLDGAVIFADIMTPLEAMGVEMTFDPGPRLSPMTVAEVVDLPDLDPSRVAHVGETIRLVRELVAEETSVIGFAGAPMTLLAYLLEGGGSKDFMAVRAALRREPKLAMEALDKLARSMRAYLRLQAGAGADVVQLFDTWAGLCDRDLFGRMVVPTARISLSDVGVPGIYFAPGAGHALDLQRAIESTGYGVDWRTELGTAFETFQGAAVQGNLDPSVLFSDPGTIRAAVRDLLDLGASRPGHIMNLGHGIDRRTPPENVAVFVEAVRS